MVIITCKVASSRNDGAFRSCSFRSLKGGSGTVGVQRPLNVVHGDYTLTSAPTRVQQLTDAPKVNDTFRISHGSTPLLPKDAVSGGRRFMLVNVWRNIREEPIERYDAQTTR